MFSFLPRSSGGFLADLHLRGYIHSQTPPTPDPWGFLSAMVDRISWWSHVSRHRISSSADVPPLLLLVLANNKNVKKRRVRPVASIHRIAAKRSSRKFKRPR